MKDLSKSQYKKIGVCIYCGTAEGPLSREHIIPLALGGMTTLPQASCPSCSQVTGEVERVVLRGSIWPVRVFRNLRSRRPEEQPFTDELTVVRSGNVEKIEVPIPEHPTLLPMPIFPVPGTLRPGYQAQGIELTGVHTLRFGPHPKEVGQQFNAEQLNIVRKDLPVMFARMLAKIAYAHVIAEKGIAVGFGAPVVASILGREDRIGHWVGCGDATITNYPNLLHRLAIMEDASTGFIAVIVHLFADSEAPEYVVVVRSPIDTTRAI